MLSKKPTKRNHSRDIVLVSAPAAKKEHLSVKTYANRRPATKSAPTNNVSSNENNNSENTKRKIECIDHSPDEKRLKSKLDTGEITIVPISVPRSDAVSAGEKRAAVEISPTVQFSATKLSPTMKRIVPVTITRNVTSFRAGSGEDSIDSDTHSKDSFTANNEEVRIAANGESSTDTVPSKESKAAQTPPNETFIQLLDACRTADSSSDMEKLINKKLMRYYQSVHSSFVNSKSFRKTVAAATAEVLANPQHVYLKINDILEELKTRRAYKDDENGKEAPEPEPVNTGDVKIDQKVIRLSRALRKLQKRIERFDNAEVNWDDDHNSAFMINERCKKRAYQIYEKICDLTGESKDALRCTKKPMKFNGTPYEEFNRKIQNFINRTKTFPDLFDVVRILKHCNQEYHYRLREEECKKIGKQMTMDERWALLIISIVPF